MLIEVERAESIIGFRAMQYTTAFMCRRVFSVRLCAKLFQMMIDVLVSHDCPFAPRHRTKERMRWSGSILWTSSNLFQQTHQCRAFIFERCCPIRIELLCSRRTLWKWKHVEEQVFEWEHLERALVGRDHRKLAHGHLG